ncbi:DMT family transporter [Consotaella salsifontis]|uniref:S-adenosylmethionine uptake transporter n=1 Tax=Consotaella salsifontis TaxID=1365950 RepID=A0A1T4QTD7_9HYPH|nr:DMT family transporter [Consotaella salsifontis]SKA07039.1 S-adenosylmethionine uptake transporter [Consotaella salsifontis]
MTTAATPTDEGRNLVLLGIILMLVGNFAFALNDALGKALVTSLAVGEVLLIRSLGAFLLLGPALARRPRGELTHPDRPWLQLLRVVMATGDTAFFYAAVVTLPLADVITFYMAGPIYVAAFSHVFLGEKVGWRRWTAILVGFVGVVVALRPSSASLSLHSFYALAGSISFALSIVLARRLRTTSDAALVTFHTLGALVLGAVMTISTWKTPSLFELGAMLLLGFVATAGHMTMTRSVKLAPASVLAPLQYTMLLWGILFGLAFFGDVPDRQILVGSAIIILAGLFIFHRKKAVDDGISTRELPRSVN